MSSAPSPFVCDLNWLGVVNVVVQAGLSCDGHMGPENGPHRHRLCLPEPRWQPLGVWRRLRQRQFGECSLYFAACTKANLRRSLRSCGRPSIPRGSPCSALRGSWQGHLSVPQAFNGGYRLGWEWRFLRKIVICVYLRFFYVISSGSSAKWAYFDVFYEIKFTSISVNLRNIEWAPASFPAKDTVPL